VVEANGRSNERFAAVAAAEIDTIAALYVTRPHAASARVRRAGKIDSHVAASAVHAHDDVAPVNGCHSSGECANLDRRTAAFLNVLHDIDGARADLTADCTRRVRLDANAIAWFEIADAIDIVAVVHRRGASATDGDHFAAVGLDHHPPVSG